MGRGKDRLEIGERPSPNYREYSAASPPVPPYVIHGNRLTIKFVSDEVKDSGIRGFQLQIFNGRDDTEVKIKIHEATKVPAKEETDSLLAILLTTLIMAALVLLGIAALICRKRWVKGQQRSDNRNVFGVRRGSGVRHSRRSDSSPPASPDQAQPPPRLHRSVQRSNSQLNWMARAELNMSIRRSPAKAPNVYTESSASTSGAAVHIGHSPTPGTGSSSRVEQWNAGADQAEGAEYCNASPNGEGSNDVHDVFKCVSDNIGKFRDTSHSFRFVNAPCKLSGDEDRTGVKQISYMTRSYEAHLNEYIDTVDCLHPQTSSDSSEIEGSPSSQPPSYESLLTSPGIPLMFNASPIAGDDCHASGHCCPARQCTNSQTNIYINAGSGADQGASLPNFTISASNCVYISPACEEGPEATRHSPSSNAEARPEAHQRANPVPHLASGAVHFIDGYAYIVPQTYPIQDKKPACSTERSSDLTFKLAASSRLDVVPESVRASPLANEMGYIDMQHEHEHDDAATQSSGVYWNVQSNQD
ncbi:unnamed protein product [Lymnaea stagnalis]|uniref:CUB domain-containing protein n=1 Tax=Lymnaea stagnalis TaxID=6523 RepID=A0AAV2IJ61_LYMST